MWNSHFTFLLYQYWYLYCYWLILDRYSSIVEILDCRVWFFVRSEIPFALFITRISFSRFVIRWWRRPIWLVSFRPVRQQMSSDWTKAGQSNRLTDYGNFSHNLYFRIVCWCFYSLLLLFWSLLSAVKSILVTSQNCQNGTNSLLTFVAVFAHGSCWSKSIIVWPRSMLVLGLLATLYYNTVVSCSRLVSDTVLLRRHVHVVCFLRID